MNYITYEAITREVLNSIKVGDLVKCNDCKRPYRVVGVSENFFMLVQYMFGKVYYSVCEKRPSEYTHNRRQKGYFTIGPDFWLSHPYLRTHEDLTNEEKIAIYLQTWESGETQFSRHAVSLYRISVKSGTVVPKEN